jgi:FkbM family methyltransferase
MGVVGALARLLPARMRRQGRNLIDTRLRGLSPALVNYRQAQLQPDLDMVLSHHRLRHPQVRYLQIGAFDGVSGDPIYPLIDRHQLKGILVEPQKDAFARLKSNYAQFGPASFVFVNAAITAEDGFSPLYRIKPEASGPAWLHQIASFDKRVLMKHAYMVPDLESMVQTEEVRAITFATLFEEAGIDRVDLLQIDAEGHDARILELFDVASRRPAIVRFEHKHLDPEDHEKAVGSLVGLGYKIWIWGSDTLAYLDQSGS